MARIVPLLLAAAAFAAITNANAAQTDEPVAYDAKVVRAFPHDPGAFTQGLFFDGGVLYETTGQYGASRLRKVALETGAPERETALPARVFGEGSTLLNGRIYVLTWRAGEGYIYDQESFALKDRFAYDGEGWGLTHDGERLIMSDGTSRLRFLDPDTLQETGRLDVTFRGKRLTQINELEWIKGEIFANVWRTDAIVRIDPQSGAVTGVIDLRNLLQQHAITTGDTDVLNGIAYDPDTDRLFVTGKFWPKLFEIELLPKETE